MKFSALFVSLGVLCVSSASCQSMTKTVAERCVLVDLHGHEGRELLPLLEQFAASHDLEPEFSHPISPRFIRGPEERARAEVKYLLGLGKFGAELTLFRHDSDQDEDLPAAFDAFVEQEVATRYNVTRCVDVPDFNLPEIYR